MVRITPTDIEGEGVHPDAKAELERQLATHGRLTNMKRTLGRSPAALAALMMWYPLRDEVAAFLGERATNLLAHAVSAQTDCLICSTYFRRSLIESGENPDDLKLDAQTASLLAYGRAMARDFTGVPDEYFRPLQQFLTEDQIVAVTAFVAMMIATNLFNNALDVDLDSYLWNYRKDQR
jgi:alkylhydroperoxidase family enzyme